MVSYNLTSLFSKIPLEETRNLTTDYLFEAKPDLKISRKDLQKLFLFATSQTNFLFNENIYEQIGRVAMTWPLAPILAYIFIGYQEHEWIKNCNYEALLYYKRHPDDAFPVCETKDYTVSFNSYINEQHSNKKFIMETEKTVNSLF